MRERHRRTRWQPGDRQAFANVWCAADDLHVAVFVTLDILRDATVIDFANVQMVGIFVLVALNDFRDQHAFVFGAKVNNFFDRAELRADSLDQLLDRIV